jgi:hypothetical protein
VLVSESDEVADTATVGGGAQRVAEYFGDLARRRDDDALNKLRRALRERDDHTYAKHVTPRLAARALLRRGPQGVTELLAALPEAPGAIHPNAIIEALWFAARGELGMDLFRVAVMSPDLTVPPDEETSRAAAGALRDVFAESRVNNELFVRLLDFVHKLWMQAATQDDDDCIVSEARELFAEATIKLTPSLLDRFRGLIEQDLGEEDYQGFLRDNPVLLDPLATEVVPKQRLGSEHVTDFALRRADARWTLVEIEKPRDPLFTSRNDFTSQFTHAFGQIIDFQRWVESHGQYARSLMPGIASPAGLLVMSRRSSLNDENTAKLNRFIENSRRIDVVTFDDVLESSVSLYNNLYHWP